MNIQSLSRHQQPGDGNSHSNHNMSGKNCATCLFHHREFRRPINTNRSMPFFSFDTFPRGSNLINRYCFYLLKIFPLLTREATLFQHHLLLYHTNSRSCFLSEYVPRISSAMAGKPKTRAHPSIRTLAVRRSQNYSGSIHKVSF